MKHSLINIFLPKKEREYIYCFKMSIYVKILSFIILSAISLLVVWIVKFTSIEYLHWWLPIFALVILGFAIISVPIAIYYDSDSFEIHSIVEMKKIELNTIMKIIPISKSYCNLNIIPVFSTCGFLGYNGFYYDILRKKILQLNCSSKSNLVLISTINNKNYMVNVGSKRDAIIKKVTDNIDNLK